MSTTSCIRRAWSRETHRRTVYYAGLGATDGLRRLLVEGHRRHSTTGPNGNKIAFIFNGGGGAGGQQFLILMPDGRLHVLPEYPGDYRWRTPNVNATVVTLGAWHKIEWYTDLSRRHVEVVARRRAAGQLYRCDESGQLRHVPVQSDMGRQQRRAEAARPITTGSTICV